MSVLEETKNKLAKLKEAAKKGSVAMAKRNEADRPLVKVTKPSQEKINELKKKEIVKEASDKAKYGPNVPKVSFTSKVKPGTEVKPGVTYVYDPTKNDVVLGPDLNGTVPDNSFLRTYLSTPEIELPFIGETKAFPDPEFLGKYTNGRFYAAKDEKYTPGTRSRLNGSAYGLDSWYGTASQVYSKGSGKHRHTYLIVDENSIIPTAPLKGSSSHGIYRYIQEGVNPLTGENVSDTAYISMDAPWTTKKWEHEIAFNPGHTYYTNGILPNSGRFYDPSLYREMKLQYEQPSYVKFFKK